MGVLRNDGSLPSGSQQACLRLRLTRPREFYSGVARLRHYVGCCFYPRSYFIPASCYAAAMVSTCRDRGSRATVSGCRQLCRQFFHRTVSIQPKTPNPSLEPTTGRCTERLKDEL